LALPSSRQNFHCLDFDQRASTLSSLQLPVRNYEPPRVFRSNGEVRAGRRKSRFAMPFFCQTSDSLDFDQ
jgi:hypothetical protein